MPPLQRKAKIVMFVFLGGLLGLMVAGGWQALSSQSLDNWLREQDKPVAAQLQKGDQLLQQGKFGEASVAYTDAFEHAKAADAQAQERWKEYIDKQPDPRKLNAPSSNRVRYGKGLSYFRSRMAEASTGLASAIIGRVQTKYRKELEAAAGGTVNFFPPASELAPALQAIDEGLAASPQNEMLRLLKSQLFTLRGQYADALEALNQLLLINADSAEAYNQMGLIFSSPLYMNSNNYEVYREKALAMFEKAALLKDMNGQPLAEPQYNLGMYYATPAAGKPENALPDPADAARAIKHLQRYLELTNGATPQAAQVRSVLARLQAAPH